MKETDMLDIVVGVDGSTASEHALDRALLEAERRGLPLRVVHAWTTPAWFTSGGLGYVPVVPAHDTSQRVAQDQVDELLAKALSRRVSSAPVAVTAVAQEGDPGRLLSDLSTGTSLLVVGGTGHGQLASALLGCVTTFVLHHAGCPVMVVPGSGHVSPPARYVVGIDGSASSRAALAWALAAAAPLRTPVVAVHVWQISTGPLPLGLPDLPLGATYQEEAATWLTDELALSVGPEDSRALVRHLPYGSATPALLGEAGEDDVLVLGSRGHGGFSSLLLGSVATQCAAHATGTVVVVHGERA